MKIIKKTIKLFKNPISFILDSNIALSLMDISSRRRNELSFYFKERSNFYKRKSPNSEKYPYNVHNPYEAFNVFDKYEKLFLVGNNWLDMNNKKPIALMVGFNNWKYGFISDYLKEYKTAYATRKLSNISSLLLLFGLNPKPNAIIVWGYTENSLIRYYAKMYNIPLYRMEDGFIRSSLLGATHATPYSLILDKQGLYYNPETQTDLEIILNTYNLLESDELVQEVNKLLKLLVDMKISKYNSPTIEKIDTLGIKLKKRVVVLGQVDNDSAIKYGNPDKWSSIELIKLAKYENPDAEVIYRPHPEVYKGYQKSRFRKKRIEYFAKVVSPEEPLLDFLDTIDHVYTINSLSGLEALLRGIKVTTVGAAFYAGWGLTDDRCKLKRRERKLSLLELFAGVYLKYPRYLADLNNSSLGLQAAVYRIKADFEIAKFDIYKNIDMEDNNKLSSVFWVQNLFDKDYLNNHLKEIDFAVYLKYGSTLFFQKIYLLGLFGLIDDEKQKSLFLKKVRTFIDYSIYSEFLHLVSKIYEEDLLLNEITWLIKQDANITITKELLEIFNNRKNKFGEDIFDNAKDNALENMNLNKIDTGSLHDALKSEITSSNYENVLNILNILDEIEVDEIEVDEIEVVRQNIEDSIYDFYEYYMNEKEFEKALHLAELMLIFGLNTQALFSKLANYSKLRFDFESAIQLYKFNQNINLYAENRNGTLHEILLYSEKNIYQMSTNDFVTQLSKLVALKPDVIPAVYSIIDKYKNILPVEETSKIIELTLNLDNARTIRKSQAMIAIEKPDKAIIILEDLLRIDPKNEKAILQYIKALSFDNQKKQAIVYCEKYILKEHIHNESFYHEAIMLYIEKGLFKKAKEILLVAENYNIDINPSFKLKVYQAERNPMQAYSQYKEFKFKGIFKKYYKDKYINSIEEISKNESLSIFAEYGPGDEIRFASMYHKFCNELKYKKLTVSCSPKLLFLLERSFPEINFISVHRLRDLYESRESDNYSALKSLELASLIDNNGVEMITTSDKITLVTDILPDFIQGYSSFQKKQYLIHDSQKTSEFKKLLPTNVKLIGINWRSSLTTHSRNIHFLTIEEIEPLFRIDNIKFVNLQYDDCSSELNWIKQRYPNKLINIESLDQYDDIDGVASLMKCLDLIITPCTSVGELAGALGCKTWMFANSYEMLWRKIDDKGSDVWHENMLIVNSDNIGNKKSLVTVIYDKLLDFVKND